MIAVKRTEEPFLRERKIGTILLGANNPEYPLLWQRYIRDGNISRRASYVLLANGPERRVEEERYSVHIVDLQELRLSVNIDNTFETILRGAHYRKYDLCTADMAVSISTLIQCADLSPLPEDSLLFLSRPYINEAGEPVILRVTPQDEYGNRCLGTYPILPAKEAKWNLNHRFIAARKLS